MRICAIHNPKVGRDEGGGGSEAGTLHAQPTSAHGLTARQGWGRGLGVGERSLVYLPPNLHISYFKLVAGEYISVLLGDMLLNCSYVYIF